MDKFRSSRQKRISQVQEKRAAEDIGGRVQAGSGNVKLGGGGDVRKRGEFRVECKYTEKTYFILKLQELVKVQTQALQGGLELPVFQISFVSPRTGAHDQYAVVSTVFRKSEDIFATTDRKRVRLGKEELQRAFLSKDKVQVIFEQKTKHMLYEVMPWHIFLQQEGARCS